MELIFELHVDVLCCSSLQLRRLAHDSSMSIRDGGESSLPVPKKHPETLAKHVIHVTDSLASYTMNGHMNTI
jgi:hypothetical protein